MRSLYDIDCEGASKGKGGSAEKGRRGVGEEGQGQREEKAMYDKAIRCFKMARVEGQVVYLASLTRSSRMTECSRWRYRKVKGTSLSDGYTD